MIIKIYKLSTRELWTMHNKNALVDFVTNEIGLRPSCSLTIPQLIQYLPVEDYHRMK